MDIEKFIVYKKKQKFIVYKIIKLSHILISKGPLRCVIYIKREERGGIVECFLHFLKKKKLYWFLLKIGT